MQAHLSPQDCDLEQFSQQVERQLTIQNVPQAHDIQKNVPIYDIGQLDLTGDTQTLRTEWADVLRNTAGVLVLKNAYANTSSIDAATMIYDKIIADEKVASIDKADHFAATGANDRIWNSAQKLCQYDPLVFAQYFGNIAIDTACQAWLGPNYQMTAQVNLVRPGGAAQSPHRDYHLGFQSSDIAASYPAHVHDLSPVLTLQGAVAHADMPIESGPTKLLPFSQIYRHGYLAFTQPDFRTYFEKHHVQVPLTKGDVLFFQPSALSRRWCQCEYQYPAHGKSSASVFSLWTGDGKSRPIGYDPATLQSIKRQKSWPQYARNGRGNFSMFGRLFLPHQSRHRSPYRRISSRDTGCSFS